MDPLHQFKIKKILDLSLFGFDISITNSSLSMICTTLIVMLYLGFISSRLRVRSISRNQSILEMVFVTSTSMLESNFGHKISKEQRKYSKYVFSLFIMLLALNLQSMVPGTFASTGQFAVTLIAGLTVMLLTLFIILFRYGVRFFSFFVPKGTPGWIAPLIMLLELISFCIRPISLCIRLGANIIAGHVMLEILAALLFHSGVYGFFGFPLMVAINLMEFAVVCLQAYIFALLASVYISEALHH